MGWGRVVTTGAASIAVVGCAVVVVGMAHAATRPSAAHKHAPTPVITSRPAVLGGVPTPTPATSTPHSTVPAAPRTSASTRTSAPRIALSTPTVVATTPAPVHRVVRTAPPSHATTHPAPRRTVAPKPTPKPKPKPKPVPRAKGGPLPLGLSTGNASRVITVRGFHAGNTTARLQAWQKVSSGHWVQWGPTVQAHIGADGMSTHASESRSATPIGSFTLTQAFGHYSNPGTHLPYRHTNGSDWWISQPGRLYNTRQSCWSGCSFNRGDPNEHLYYETPYYNYAVVIDYNTRNAPGGVHQGAGSAFFLHVTDGHPTAGCVAIPQSRLVPLMRWLTPSTHPRILIGVRS